MQSSGGAIVQSWRADSILGRPNPRLDWAPKSCRETNFIMRFLRIHPVQKVINNPTQLSGRGFPRIFHMELFSSQLYVFWYFKIEAEPCNSNICKFEFRNFEIMKISNFEISNFAFSNFQILKFLKFIFF